MSEAHAAAAPHAMLLANPRVASCTTPLVRERAGAPRGSSGRSCSSSGAGAASRVAAAASTSMSGSTWAQKELVLPVAKRGCHLITRRVEEALGGDLARIRIGVAHVFIQHTSASLTINENADPDVRADLETYLNAIVPEGPNAPWRHTDEGYDDMPAHCKAATLGSSITIPITDGRFNLGTWQGIWLCEHRDQATPRHLVVTLQGATKE